MYFPRHRRRAVGQPGLYKAHGAHFDGTNDSMLGTSLSTADASRLVLSMWFRRNAVSSANEYLFQATGFRVYVQLLSTDHLRIRARNSSNTDIWRHQSAATTSDTNWHHVFAFIDCSGDGNSFVFVDGVDASVVTTETTDTINSGVTTYAIGATTSAGSRFAGDLAEVVLVDPGRAVVAADVNRFISGGRPQYLGAEGKAPFGVQPLFYMRGDHTNFGTNSGSAGDLTVTGALTAADRLYKAGA